MEVYRLPVPSLGMTLSEYMKTFAEGISTEYLVELRWLNLSTLSSLAIGVITEYLAVRLKQVQIDSPSPPTS